MIINQESIAIVSLVVGTISLAVSAVALVVAVRQIRKTQSAAQSAAQAATEARDVVQRVTSVSAMSQATVLIGSLIDIIRYGRWQRAIDRYAPLRKLLIDVEVRLPPEKKDDEGKKLARAIEQLLIMEKESGKANAEGTEIEVARFQSMLLEIQNDIVRIHAKVEWEITDRT